MTSTNFPDGVTNQDEYTGLGSYVAPSPGRVHQWFDDFDGLIAAIATTPAVPGSYVVTAAGSSTATVASADNGILTITTGATTGNGIAMQWAGSTGTVVESFRWNAAKNLWFEARLQVSDASASSLAIGLAITDTSPDDASDALLITKAAASTALQFKAIKNSTSTAVSAGTLVAGNFVKIGFVYSADVGTVTTYVDDQVSGSTPVTANFPDDEDLAVTISFHTGADAAKTALVDYAMVSKDR
jgi:hypothetical protein